MNLYKIEFAHYSQKDSDNGIKEYILANNDEEVFDYINKNYTWDDWTEREDEWDDEDQTYKEFVLENKGDDGDESLFNDLYYGQTTYSWELIKENISEENAKILIDLEIITKGEK